MKKIINVYETIRYSDYAAACRFCELKKECKQTDAQTCLRQRHAQTIDLLNLNTEDAKWVILMRDHADGNGKGEYFAAADYDKIKAAQPYWFTNTDRPVHTVILTDDDVPSIINKRNLIINALQNLDVEINKNKRPAKDFDGRKTRRTAPELYADYDKRLNAYNAAVSRLIDQKTDLYAALQTLPHYSTTLKKIM